jgi:hypothetical protein
MAPGIGPLGPFGLPSRPIPSNTMKKILLILLAVGLMGFVAKKMVEAA